MLLLPTEQTVAQQKPLFYFATARKVEVCEPCDCGSQIRHNNGGDYHTVISFRMDAGKCWRPETHTGDYGPPDDWQEIGFGAATDEMAVRAAEGWYWR